MNVYYDDARRRSPPTIVPRKGRAKSYQAADGEELSGRRHRTCTYQQDNRHEPGVNTKDPQPNRWLADICKR